MPTVELHRRTRLKWWLVGIVYTAIAVLLGIDAYNIPPMHPSQHVSPLLWVFLVVPLAVPVLAMWHRTASHYVLLRVLAIPCLLVSGILFVAYAMAWDDFAMPTPIWTIAGFFLSVVEILVVFAQLCMRGLWLLMKAG